MNCADICYQGELYGPWGSVNKQQGHNAYGVASCRHLRTALLAMDDELLDWQCSFPGDVVDEVVRYPQAHIELLELAYLMPERFVELSRTCPALVAMVSVFWAFCEEYDGRRPDNETVLKFWGWFYLSPKREVLARLGFGKARSNFRILTRMHILDCDIASLGEVRYLLTHPQTRKVARYLSDFNRVVRVLLHWGYRDFHLLELAAKEPKRGGEALYSVIADIREWLDRGLVKEWPYRGAIRTWEQALWIRSRLHSRFGEDPFGWSLGGAKFPAPPFHGAIVGDSFALEPIECLEELERETEDMQNCAVTFALNVSKHQDVYFYRLLSPARATVQLVKSAEGEWGINQIVGYDNSKVDSNVWKLVEQWVRSGKEVRDGLV